VLTFCSTALISILPHHIRALRGFLSGMTMVCRGALV
jgi:hypothetical protein